MKIKKVKKLKKTENVVNPEITIMADISPEQVVLAAMMLDVGVLRDLAVTLNPEIFVGERHQVIFRVLRKLAERGLEYSIETFESEASGSWSYGGRKYLGGLTEAYPNALVNLDYHVEKLQLASLKLRLRTGAVQRLLDFCSDPTIELEELQTQTREITSQIEGWGTSHLLSGEALEKRYMADIYGRMETGNFIPTGFAQLDDSLTEGLAPKRISVWTARPNIGKSTWAWNMALRLVTIYEIPTVYFALEMTAESVMDGMVSALSHIDLDQLIKRPQELGTSDMERIEGTVKQLVNSGKLAIWDKSITLEKAARIIKEGGFKVAIWDLWEKIVREKRSDAIAAKLDETQQLAKETNCHFALVHQTRRGVERRKNRRPTLEDLKNSGGYEEVADLVIAFYREIYYQPNISQDVFEVGILKQRRGARLVWHFFEFDGCRGRIGKEVDDWEPNFEA